jgi:2-dehydro-3-deoxyphosphogluconate aldolase / (4S)-4-hydroxy-2-oxoglutarate aldolase
MDPTLQEATVVERLREARVVPVVTIRDGDRARDLARALVRGGVPCVEIALRTDAATAAIRAAREVDGLVVGAGTVLTPEQVREAVDAGADFAVAPGTNESVVRACRDAGLPFFPGVATPTEIEHARALGLRTVKVFPASCLGGGAFLRAVSATYPDMAYIPTGGIRASDLRDYLSIPSVVAVGGSWLVAEQLVDGGRFDEVERLAREAAEVVL